MNEAVQRAGREDTSIEQLAHTLESGLVLVDAHGEVVWMDQNTRRHVNGGLKHLDLPLRRESAGVKVDCFLSAVDVEIKGGTKQLCIIQAADTEEAPERDVRRVFAAIEDSLSDPSWLTEQLIEKLKARLQAAQPFPRVDDLDLLTPREREILGLVCEGRTDAEMGQQLNLSQNTVRNHLASVFRKIGVNRRSAAVIWARERALTRHDIFAFTGPKRQRPHSER